MQTTNKELAAPPIALIQILEDLIQSQQAVIESVRLIARPGSTVSVELENARTHLSKASKQLKVLTPNLEAK